MKMHHGITVMLKNSLIVLFLIFIIVRVTVYFDSDSRTYWESVGPAWDRMLNPNKYEEQSE